MTWDDPVKNLRAADGKMVTIDVTLSVQPSLGPNGKIHEVIDFFRRQGVQDVLDYGAGALRHTFPLLDAGFDVCAVEFERQYARPGTVSVEKKTDAERRANFRLKTPSQLVDCADDFDAALLCFVAQGMPIAQERARVLRVLYRKLRDHDPPTGREPPEASFLVWMTRYDRTDLPAAQLVKDGMFKPQRKENGRQLHSFYREYDNQQIKEMLGKVLRNHGFYRVRSLGDGGRDQLYVYSKQPGVKWDVPAAPAS